MFQIWSELMFIKITRGQNFCSHFYDGKNNIFYEHVKMKNNNSMNMKILLTTSTEVSLR